MENNNSQQSSSGTGDMSYSLQNETEEQDSDSKEVPVEEVLANFRELWQRELKSPQKLSQKPAVTTSVVNEESNFEDAAKYFFLKGIEMERSGKLYEAIQFYRKAVQIVPDIEFRLENISKTKLKEEVNDETEGPLDDYKESGDESEETIEEGQLMAYIRKKCIKSGTLCIPRFNNTATHISILPVEILLYILKWLVSADLDLRSLELFSMACRGFYLCARDEEIWRVACLRIWGLNCGSSPGIYRNWREMYIERPKVHFNGCYISKTSYIRHGENNFQDQFYRPWHLVTYYRYLRFFPEGLLLMLTTPDEPTQSVGLLKNRSARSPVLTGYYRLKGDILTLVVQRVDTTTKPIQTFTRKYQRSRREVPENTEQTFQMEIQIRNHRNKRHIQLVWKHYSILTKNKKGDESTCIFDLIANRFPPLWFSRVKSFTAESEHPLA